MFDFADITSPLIDGVTAFKTIHSDINLKSMPTCVNIRYYNK